MPIAVTDLRNGFPCQPEYAELPGAAGMPRPMPAKKQQNQVTQRPSKGSSKAALPPYQVGVGVVGRLEQQDVLWVTGGRAEVEPGERGGGEAVMGSRGRWNTRS